MVAMIQDLIALVAFGAAFVFGIAGVAGLYRFPDVYARLQASSLCSTTAVFSIFIGALVLAPSWAIAARLLVIILFFLVSGPTGSHIVARFAWNAGLDPWKPMKSIKPQWQFRKKLPGEEP
ncbi:MAG: monovalent cation/H(+) antiporter subunit G [Spirochaetota bacterium]